MFTTAALRLTRRRGTPEAHRPIGKYVSGIGGKLSRVTAHQREATPRHPGRWPRSARMTTARSHDGQGLDDDYVFVEPGRVMSYLEPGADAAGYVLEQVAKKPYADAIASGCSSRSAYRSTFRPTVAMTWPFAQGHQRRPAGRRPPLRRTTAGYWPAGFLISNVSDLRGSRSRS